MKRLACYAGSVMVLFVVVVFVFSSFLIGRGVKMQCGEAKQKYQGDCVVVLAQTVDDQSNSLEQRKQAVWALGQLGDGKALPVLEEYYQGNNYQCDHENKLCQYELAKAIKLIKSGFNPTALVWRNRLFEKQFE